MANAILAAVLGALTAAIVGGLIVGTIVNWITRRAQDRRESYELRRELITEMTEPVSALVYTITHYRRAEEGTLGQEIKLTDILPVLHEQYRKTRTAGKVVENRLAAYFESKSPARAWHAGIDLLAVRYYEVLGSATPELRETNAGEGHSGLTVEELADPDLVKEKFEDAMRTAIIAVRTERRSKFRTSASRLGRASLAELRRRSLTVLSQTERTAPD